MTELGGEAYLLNLSLLAITFSAVSVLVMLVRQSMGGKLSNFDIHLVSSYVARGFVIAVAAVIPPLLADFDLHPQVFWAIASLLACFLLIAGVFRVQRERFQITKVRLPRFPVFVLGAHWLAAALLIANAILPTVQGGGLFKVALTMPLATVMWAFVRRIGSLLGDTPGEDWDPTRG